jgi:ribosomal protein L14E/L6E/L27E
MQGLEEYEKYELIKRTCKNTTKNANITDIEKVNEFKRKRNNFINRMMIDVCLRDNRDKNFNEIKYVVDMKTNHDFDSISRSVSPLRKDRSN